MITHLRFLCLRVIFVPFLFFKWQYIFTTKPWDLYHDLYVYKSGKISKFADQIVSEINIDKDLKGLTLRVEERKKKAALLTPREAQVIKKVLMGLSNKDIGELLGLSERTVENHRAAAYKKLAVSSAAELKDFVYFIWKIYPL